MDGLKKYLEDKTILDDKWYKGNYFYHATIWKAIPFTKIENTGVDRV